MAGKLTDHGKGLIVRAMYQKGEAFLLSALLLRERANAEATQYVVRHLICQSIEIILKTALLLIDYDKYIAVISHRRFGHNINSLANEVIRAASLKPLRPAIEKELNELSHFYSQHLLRYAGLQDIFHQPDILSYTLVLRRLRACIRLMQILGRRAQETKPAP